MSRSHTILTDELSAYLREVSLREPDVLRRLREETAQSFDENTASMQISPEQGQFLAMLVRLIDARNTLEVGVFTGYSSLSVALALPDGGKVVACDLSDRYTSIARRYWGEAGVAGKIDLRLGPALATLDALIAEGRAGSFDFAFIDADKRNYANYYERALQLLRPGGLIAVDNVLWHGRVVDPRENDGDTQAIREFNRSLHTDDRIDLSMLPIGDGVTLARKKR
jgi:predicted O-methyltransferase YrrM